MKVVYASTPEQEQKIKELMQNIYSDIFPLYFLDEEIKEFERLKVLQTSTRHFEYFGTLKEAYQVIVSLQTIISILEMEQLDRSYEAIFNKNVRTIQEFDILFPFDFNNFYSGKMLTEDILSIYTKAANEYLI